MVQPDPCALRHIQQQDAGAPLRQLTSLVGTDLHCCTATAMLRLRPESCHPQPACKCVDTLRLCAMLISRSLTANTVKFADSVDQEVNMIDISAAVATLPCSAVHWTCPSSSPRSNAHTGLAGSPARAPKLESRSLAATVFSSMTADGSAPAAGDAGGGVSIGKGAWDCDRRCKIPADKEASHVRR